MIYPLISKIQYQAIKHPFINMASFGAIELFDNKPNIQYPYVNLDIVSSRIRNYLKIYTIRMYICDRNEPYIAYNKTEVAADDILKSMDIHNYQVNYFSPMFKDVVHGVWADFEIEVPLEGSCTYDTLFNSSLLLEDGNFYLQENGDLFTLQNNK